MKIQQLAKIINFVRNPETFAVQPLNIQENAPRDGWIPELLNF